MNGAEKCKSFVKNLDNNQFALITIGYNKGIVDTFMDEKEIVKYEDMKLSSKYMTKYFKKHDIKNDNDLIKYLTDYAKKVNPSIFFSYSKLKDSYVTLELAKRMLNTDKNITLLKGTYTFF